MSRQRLTPCLCHGGGDGNADEERHAEGAPQDRRAPAAALGRHGARTAGASRVVAILGHKHEIVKAALDASFGAGAVDVALQPEQRGTGHAVQCALPAVANEPDDRIVVILTGDAPLLASERIAELTAACARIAGRAWRCCRRCRRARCRTDASCASGGKLAEDRRAPRRDRGAARDPGHERRVLRDQARSPPQGPRRAARRQREGRALPDRPRRARGRARRCDVDRRAVHRGRRHQRSRRSRGRRGRGAPADQRGVDARRRDDGRSGEHVHRCGRRPARQGRLDRAERRAARQDHASATACASTSAACSPT